MANPLTTTSPIKDPYREPMAARSVCFYIFASTNIHIQNLETYICLLSTIRALATTHGLLRGGRGGGIGSHTGKNLRVRPVALPFITRQCVGMHEGLLIKPCTFSNGCMRNTWIR